VFYRKEGRSVYEDGRGETGRSNDEQRLADATWWYVARDKRPKIRLLVVVVSGVVRRIWPVDPAGPWDDAPNGSGKVALPLGEHPLEPEEVQALYPDLGIAEDDLRPARQGLLREYVPVDGTQG
jgi:hypothetical protein